MLSVDSEESRKQVLLWLQNAVRDECRLKTLPKGESLSAEYSQVELHSLLEAPDLLRYREVTCRSPSRFFDVDRTTDCHKSVESSILHKESKRKSPDTGCGSLRLGIRPCRFDT